MKNKIYIILVAYVLSIVATSCKEDTEYIFDESASERKAEAIEKYEQALKSSENGWVFQYFPEENQQYGGYTYVVKFSENDSVAVWSELMGNLNNPVISLYDVIGTGGPTLTFNTYNGLMHFFATPTRTNYQAYGGDYEFLFLSEEDDVISVKGTKTGNEMRLLKLNENPETYINKVSENVTFLSGVSFSGSIGDSEIEVSAANRNFTFGFTENGTDTTITVSYIITDAGIRFYEPIEIMGMTYQDFTSNFETEQIVSNDGSFVLQLTIPPLNEQFVAGDWYIAYSQLGALGQAYFDVVKQGEDAIGEVLQVAFIGSEYYGSFGFNFISSGYQGLLGIDYELIDEDKVTLVFNFSGEGDGVWYHNNANFAYALFPFGYRTARTFTLTTDDVKSPSYITLTEDGNPDNVITLSASQIVYPFEN